MKVQERCQKVSLISLEETAVEFRENLVGSPNGRTKPVRVDTEARLKSLQLSTFLFGFVVATDTACEDSGTVAFVDDRRGEPNDPKRTIIHREIVRRVDYVAMSYACLVQGYACKHALTTDD